MALTKTDHWDMLFSDELKFFLLERAGIVECLGCLWAELSSNEQKKVGAIMYEVRTTLNHFPAGFDD